MENKINIVELLKDCPSGMELDCTICDNVYFDKVTPNMIKCYFKNDVFNTIYFHYDGTYLPIPNAKCVIFPKGKTTWEGFQRPFNDGDIVTYKLRGSLVAFIYKERTSTMLVESHCALYAQNMRFCVDGDIALKEEEIVFATSEEKQKLFKAIKDNGYKWNSETKTLEKLIVPKFKIGDWVEFKYYERKPEKVIRIENDVYWLSSGRTIMFQDESAWDLATKFDITTLNPYDKVLVRCNSLEKWHIQFFEKYNRELGAKYPFICLCNSKYCQCVPFDGNEHLLDTTDSCADYYKTWE